MREIIIRLALAAVACWTLVLQHGLVPMFETTLRHPNVILANILGGWTFSPDERLAYFGSATAFGVAIVLWIVTPLLEDFFSYQRRVLVAAGGFACARGCDCVVFRRGRFALAQSLIRRGAFRSRVGSLSAFGGGVCLSSARRACF